MRIVFLNVMQSSQQSTCSKVPFLLRSETLLIKRFWHKNFLVNFPKVLRTVFIIEHVRWLLLKLLKDTHKEKVPSNKTPALTKSTNIGI